MQFEVPMAIGVDSVLTVVGFAGAVVYQSAMLRNSLKAVTERLIHVEQEMKKITQILVEQASQGVRLTALMERVATLERLFDAPTQRRKRTT